MALSNEGQNKCLSTMFLMFFFLELLSTFMLELKVGYASLVIVLDGERWHSLMRDKINVSFFKFVDNIPNISRVHCTSYKNIVAHKKLNN